MVHIDDIGTGNDKCFQWYNHPSQLLNTSPKPHIVFTYQHTNTEEHTHTHTMQHLKKEKRLPFTHKTQKTPDFLKGQCYWTSDLVSQITSVHHYSFKDHFLILLYAFLRHLSQSDTVV